jgi:asparagine synthase (glutamine-hydrolysing)
MSAIFGFIYLDNQPGSFVKAQLERMKRKLETWGPDGLSVVSKNSVGFGHAKLSVTDESEHESLPSFSQDPNLLFTASARLDNRTDLLNQFNIPASEHSITPDTRLVQLAYLRWGKDTGNHIFGDWAFAACNPQTKEFFLARDQLGNTALYYYSSDKLFAFSTDLHSILELEDIDSVLNEVQLATTLVYFGDREFWNHTYWKDIYALLPAMAVSISNNRPDFFEYWSYDSIPEIRYSSETDYIEGFLSHFRRSVQVRLRSKRPVGTTLSAGLDSSSVTAFAAEHLLKKNTALPAFTSVPLHHAEKFAPKNMTNEWDIAHTLAEQYQNIDHIPIGAAELPVHKGILKVTDLYGVPSNNFGNVNWILTIMDRCRQMDLGVLLTGQMGNAIISWHGGTNRVFYDLLDGRFGHVIDSIRQEKSRRNRSWLFLIAKHLLAPVLLPLWYKRENLFLTNRKLLSGSSIIDPGFADRIDLRQVIRASESFRTFSKPKRPVIQRAYSLDINKAAACAAWHRQGAMHKLEVRDPTADVKLLSFCFGIPNELFSKEGLDRYFLRTSMKGILSEEIRLNKKRGRQAADYPLRTIEHKDDILALITKLQKSPVAGQYLDFRKIIASAQSINKNQPPSEMKTHASIILRGLSFGYFLDTSFHSGQ